MSDAVRPFLHVTGLVKRYDDGGRDVLVLDALELDVAAGETVAIVGESGVGKSTLLHVLGALDRPTSGTVELDGQALGAMSSAELAEVRNRKIGFVFQFHHLLADFTAEENAMMPCLVAGQSADEARTRAREVLERVGLSHRLDHKPGELSGGEQQRVSVARAIVLGPALVLADEPTGNLDPAIGDETQQLLLELNRERGVAFVIATHNPRLAAAMQRTLRLAGGRLHPA